MAVISLTAVLLLGIFFGIKQGKALAQAGAVLADVRELGKGLDIFFTDQNRFPSQPEFSDSDILLTYFTSVPKNIPDSSACAENFSYNRLSAAGYVLDFCLAADLGQYHKGWNRINVQR